MAQSLCVLLYSTIKTLLVLLLSQSIVWWSIITGWQETVPLLWLSKKEKYVNNGQLLHIWTLSRVCPPKMLCPFFSSRQRYMLGDGAMIKMAQSKVFLSGLGGLGVEIGKLNAKAQAHYTVVTKGLFYFLVMIRLLWYLKCLSKLGVMNIYAYRCNSISSMHLFNHIFVKLVFLPFLIQICWK